MNRTICHILCCVGAVMVFTAEAKTFLERADYPAPPGSIIGEEILPEKDKKDIRFFSMRRLLREKIVQGSPMVVSHWKIPHDKKYIYQENGFNYMLRFDWWRYPEFNAITDDGYYVFSCVYPLKSTLKQTDPKNISAVIDACHPHTSIATIRSCKPRLEKTGENEYLLTELQAIYDEESGSHWSFRLAVAYLIDDLILISEPTWSPKTISLYVGKNSDADAQKINRMRLKAFRVMARLCHSTGELFREQAEETQKIWGKVQTVVDEEKEWKRPKVVKYEEAQRAKHPEKFVYVRWGRDECDGSTPMVADTLGLKSPGYWDEGLRYPNVNEGVGGMKFLKKFYKKHAFTVIRESGGDVELDVTFSVDGINVRYLVYHLYTYRDAWNELFTVCVRKTDGNLREVYLQGKEGRKDELAKGLKYNPGMVGDIDVCIRRRTGEDGALIPGSERSALYFIRGNTAVGIFSDDPTYNALPLARELDRQLVIGLDKAGIPLKRRQAHLPPKPQSPPPEKK